MDFIKHTIHWAKGEIFEAIIYGSFGLLTIIGSLLFWIFGTTLHSKSAVIPFALVGIFFLLTAIFGIANNKKRLREYTDSYHINKIDFVLSEKKRVEDFQHLYKMTIIIASVCFAVALLFFYLSNNYFLRAVGLALILLGMTGLIVDFFSKERADNYYRTILMEIERNKNH